MFKIIAFVYLCAMGPNILGKVTSFRKRFRKPIPKTIPIDQVCKAAKYSGISYRHPEKIDGDDFTFFESNETGAQAYLWTSCVNELYLSIRGSSDFTDALTNIDIRESNIGPGVKVHRGFYRQYCSIKDELINEINTRLGNQGTTNLKTLVVCGHSLGGAVATIAGVHLAQLFPQLHVHCFTFGSPRVGNRLFVCWFHQYVKINWRIINYRDPVPLIPVGVRFMHTRHAICFDDDNHHPNIFKNDHPWFVRPFALLVRFNPIRPIYDHKCDLYLKRILNAFSFSNNGVRLNL